MRDYAKVGPQFWIGKTGKKLRAAGPEAQIVGMYLMTSPHANMIGLYYVSKNSIGHETGLGEEGASKGLLGCIEAGFCSYDDESEMVWVHEMAIYQIADALVATDKRCQGIQNEYNALPDNPYLARFFEKYVDSYHMKKKRGIDEKAIKSLAIKQAPSKPHRSQEQEQEQEQEQDHAQEQEVAAPENPEPAPKREKFEPDSKEAWLAYGEAYRQRYGAYPVRNAPVNTSMAAFVKRVGKAEAPGIAAFYVGHNNSFYVRSMHPVKILLADAEKLRTEWATDRTVTATQAAQVDKTQTNLNVFGPMIEAAKAREALENENAE